MIPQPMPDDEPPSEPSDASSQDEPRMLHASSMEITWKPAPLSGDGLAPVDMPETHICWLCGHRGAPRTRSGLWLSVWRALQTGPLLVWCCSPFCHFCAVTLIDGLAGLLDIR